MPRSYQNSALFSRSSWTAGGSFLSGAVFARPPKAVVPPELFSESASGGPWKIFFLGWSFFWRRPKNGGSQKTSFAGPAFFLSGSPDGPPENLPHSSELFLARARKSGLWKIFLKEPSFFWRAPEIGAFKKSDASRGRFFWGCQIGDPGKKASRIEEDFFAPAENRPRQKKLRTQRKISGAAPISAGPRKSSAVGVTFLEAPQKGPVSERNSTSGGTSRKKCSKQAARGLL